MNTYGLGTSVLGQVLLAVSAQLETAATVALLRKAFDMIFAFVIQILFFEVSNNPAHWQN